jgi:hypothetical protein
MAIRFLGEFFRRSVEEKLPSSKPVKPAADGDTRFRAVSIHAGEQCCEAARQFGNMRFLCAKAPRLPVPGCDAVSCECRYVHFTDRRSGEDRRGTYDWTRERQMGFVNRRSRRGRRSTDPIA